MRYALPAALLLVLLRDVFPGAALADPVCAGATVWPGGPPVAVAPFCAEVPLRTTCVVETIGVDGTGLALTLVTCVPP